MKPNVLARKLPMLSLYSTIIENLARAVKGDPFWEPYLGPLSDGRSTFALHLAVMVEPFLSYMLEGRKTIESRFSVKRTAPFNRIHPGDVILLKKAGGPVVAILPCPRHLFLPTRILIRGGQSRRISQVTSAPKIRLLARTRTSIICHIDQSGSCHAASRHIRVEKTRSAWAGSSLHQILNLRSYF